MQQNNMGMLMQAMKNPQAFVQQVMQSSQINQNPIARNAFEMYQKGDTKGLEALARNLCAEKGIKPEDALKQIKSQFGM
jgi:hypothetical protein